MDEVEEIACNCRKGENWVLGKAHPDTLMSLIDLGRMYADQGRSDEAEKLEP